MRAASANPLPRLLESLERGPLQIMEVKGGYAALVTGASGRQVRLALTEAHFRDLARHLPVIRLDAGRWRVRKPAAGTDPIAVRVASGHLQRQAGPEAAPRTRLVNRNESSVSWLASHRDARGQPFLSAREVAAGARLEALFQQAGGMGRLTLNLEAVRICGQAGPANWAPEQVLRARTAVRQALERVSPECRPMVEQICLNGSALALAEQRLSIPRRQGRQVLRRGLGQLADYFGLV